ncbi:MAG TPA: MYXO-CTERM sorting domain-containing protein [candidate division Zixibacteria bacterium]|nr:MYXO-CTERM sorting domain-containing protein [candidate division Zixibacteria bacterium]
MPRPLPLFIRAAAGAVMLAAALAGCGEKDVPVVVDRDILLRYLATSEDAVDLFRTTGLFPTEEYRIPNDPARYRIVVDSTRRIITLDTEIDTVKKRTWPDGSVEYYRSYHDYGNPFGRLWASEATVDDYFYVRLSRTEDEETATASHVWAITRYGYFLKLGGDDQPYVGWKLWAYNGGAAPTGGVATTGGTTPTGGVPTTGGTMTTGGIAPTGGVAVTGGGPATGGALPATGGSATGGNAAGGVTPTAGGTATTGGAVATGGASAVGGATGGDAAPAASANGDDDPGCGCRVPARRSSPFGQAGWLAVAVLGLARLRRRPGR